MYTQQSLITAPEFSVSQWFNAEKPITLQSLRGKVVVLGSFQMLCPGCVSHGLPQLQQIAALFPSDKVAVIGLHTVFEHHSAMSPVSLEAFIHEYRLTFPIGVDERGTGAVPKTMQAYSFRGTPSLALIDKSGRLRASHFGQTHDLQIGAEIAELLTQPTETLGLKPEKNKPATDNCDDGACELPDLHTLDA